MGLISYAESLVNVLPTAKCNICGHSGVYEKSIQALKKILLLPDIQNKEKNLEKYNFRESILCENCGSISRDRGLILGLMYAQQELRCLSEWERKPEVRVFETAAYRGHPHYLKNLFDYFPTQYNPEKLKQSNIDGKLYADIQRMPYPDNFFDIVMSSDVLEHVRLYVEALKEIYRVMKQEGYFLLQVPYVHGWPETRIKVHPLGEKDVFLYPPEYHAENTLVYRIYGRDLLEALKQTGFLVAYIEIDVIYLGISPQSLIVCKKGDYLDINGFINLLDKFKVLIQ